MIPWYFSQNEIRGFKDLPTKKKSKKRKELMVKIQEQEREIRSSIKNAKSYAEDAKRYDDKNDLARRKEAILAYKMNLRILQPLLNQYVSDKLKIGMYELMSLDGFNFPDKLIELRKDIDFGLFSVDIPNDLEEILIKEVDPFDELKMDLSEF